MCFINKGKVGYRTKGSTRTTQTKPGKPKRPTEEEINRLKLERLVGLERMIAQRRMELRKRQKEIAEKLRVINRLPHIQRLGLVVRREERSLREEDANIARNLQTIQSIPRDGEGSVRARERWLRRAA